MRLSALSGVLFCGVAVLLDNIAENESKNSVIIFGNIVFKKIKSY